MRLEILTLFPTLYTAPLDESILARARDKGIVDLRVVDVRAFTQDRHHTVDDRPYGGEAGMLMKPGPLFAALEQQHTSGAHVVLMTPQGARFTQATARRLAREPHLILVCGHYEGIDERVRHCLVDEELSIGDYVLTSGNLAAMVVADAVIRLLPGALGSPESAEAESHGEQGLLDFAQFTRPDEFRGMRVPDVLRSGNHGKVEVWRRNQSVLRTIARRPDLL